MPKKKKKVTYLTKDLSRSKGGYTVLKYANFYVESDHVKRYFSTIGLLSKLSKTHIIILHFLSEEMDDKNLVTNNEQLHIRLNRLIDKVGGKKLSSSTIHSCFARLKKISVI